MAGSSEPEFVPQTLDERGVLRLDEHFDRTCKCGEPAVGVLVLNMYLVHTDGSPTDIQDCEVPCRAHLDDALARLGRQLRDVPEMVD